MTTARVEVFVQLKEGMLDPQGKALENALEALRYEGVENLRVGKWITFGLQAPDRPSMEKQVEEMCRSLLANPVIERYRFRIEDAS